MPPKIYSKPTLEAKQLPLPSSSNFVAESGAMHPIHNGYSQSLIRIDDQKHISKKLSLTNRYLQSSQKKSYQRKKELLERITWAESKKSSDQGLKYHWIARANINASIPQFLRDVPAFVCFKYNGTACAFGGVFIEGVHYVVWIGQKPNDVYNH